MRHAAAWTILDGLVTVTVAAGDVVVRIEAWCIFSLPSAGGTRKVAGRVPRDQDAELNGAGRRAVACCAQFPVGVIPRPLVLLGDPFRVEKGFSTGDAKIAFQSGAVEAAAGVPEEAVRPIRPSAVHTGGRPRGPLLVSAAELSAAEFDTDRGRQRLPAWRLEATDALGPIWVLTAEARARCWSLPGPAGGLTSQADGPGMYLPWTSRV
ncbi:MAG: hypothetical protein ACRDNW_24860, partial [Trebonia sp.]